MLPLFAVDARSAGALNDCRSALTHLRASAAYKDLKARYSAALFATTHVAKCEQALLAAISSLT